MHISNSIILLVILIGSKLQTFGGNYPEAISTYPAYSTPTNLARRIADTDHIVATNWFDATHGDLGFGVSISDDKVGKIVRAVSAAKKYPNLPVTSSIWDWELQFYKGTNRLDTIRFQGSVFLADGEYDDETDVLEKVHQDLVNRVFAANLNKEGNKYFSATNKAEAKQWLKKPSHTPFKESKKKVARFVEDFYDSGATKVFVADLETSSNGQTEIAKSLIVVLPRDSASRHKVFSVATRASREWWNDPDGDVGQMYLFYVFESGKP
jgi:hypothetical protein